MAVFVSAAVTAQLHQYESAPVGSACRLAFSLSQAVFFVLPFAAIMQILNKSPRFTLEKTLILPIAWFAAGSANNLFQIALDQMGSPAAILGSKTALRYWNDGTTMMGVTLLMVWFAGAINWIWAHGFIRNRTSRTRE